MNIETRLLELSKAATSAPWRIDMDGDLTTIMGGDMVVADVPEEDSPAEPDAALIVTLRNYAEAIARVVAAARVFLKDFNGLVSDSGGVDRLHKNGDVAEWSELLPGGYMEEWLGSHGPLTAALSALALLSTPAPGGA